MERHFVEHLAEFAPMVQILDAPAPQMVDIVLDALRILVRPLAVQVIEVPKILIDVIPARSLVPSADRVVSYAHRFAHRGADR